MIFLCVKEQQQIPISAFIHMAYTTSPLPFLLQQPSCTDLLMVLSPSQANF